VGDVYAWFIGLQKIGSMTCHRQGIGRNLSSADSTSTSRRVNARFWSRKRIWETCDMAAYTSAIDGKSVTGGN